MTKQNRVTAKNVALLEGETIAAPLVRLPVWLDGRRVVKGIIPSFAYTSADHGGRRGVAPRTRIMVDCAFDNSQHVRRMLNKFNTSDGTI